MHSITIMFIIGIRMYIEDKRIWVMSHGSANAGEAELLERFIYTYENDVKNFNSEYCVFL